MGEKTDDAIKIIDAVGSSLSDATVGVVGTTITETVDIVGNTVVGSVDVIGSTVVGTVGAVGSSICSWISTISDGITGCKQIELEELKAGYENILNLEKEQNRHDEKMLRERNRHEEFIITEQRKLFEKIIDSANKQFETKIDFFKNQQNLLREVFKDESKILNEHINYLEEKRTESFDDMKKYSILSSQISELEDKKSNMVLNYNKAQGAISDQIAKLEIDRNFSLPAGNLKINLIGE